MKVKKQNKDYMMSVFSIYEKKIINFIVTVWETVAPPNVIVTVWL